MDDVDYSPLGRALARLKEALDAHDKHPADDMIRDAAIQRFEFTYELAHTLLRRYLESRSSGGEGVDAMSFPRLIRTASEKGLLLHGWDVWEGFRKARNQTSHTYNETAALEVVQKLPAFAVEAEYMFRRLTEEME